MVKLEGKSKQAIEVVDLLCALKVDDLTWVAISEICETLEVPKNRIAAANTMIREFVHAGVAKGYFQIQSTPSPYSGRDRLLVNRVASVTAQELWEARTEYRKIQTQKSRAKRKAAKEQAALEEFQKKHPIPDSTPVRRKRNERNITQIRSEMRAMRNLFCESMDELEEDLRAIQDRWK